MSRLFPYPLLFSSLLLFWLLLNEFTISNFILGFIIALIASQSMRAFEPEKIRIRSYTGIIHLFCNVFVDIIQSNIDVAKLILSRQKKSRRAGFVAIPLELDNKIGLVLLACIITATPGTAWVDYHAARSELVIHVLDLENPEVWRDSIKQRYERLLLEIFA